jgi:hypothetical protein
MVVGIIVHENGGNPYSTAVIDEGVRHALARAGLCDQVCRPWCWRFNGIVSTNASVSSRSLPVFWKKHAHLPAARRRGLQGFSIACDRCAATTDADLRRPRDWVGVHGLLHACRRRSAGKALIV